ncbi:hypothetical protein DM02DRAFT_607838 [Periconia macrospinosa]|uniref:Secreted protein n=1 Tax=Periconia macrospinosa TaxID=97972 RepID=A0A2V1ED25_9PLEO|nr:hypothetical protein DM02DRAFT_607838 [Periconia macrospinosa]
MAKSGGPFPPLSLVLLLLLVLRMGEEGVMFVWESVRVHGQDARILLALRNLRYIHSRYICSVGVQRGVMTYMRVPCGRCQPRARQPGVSELAACARARRDGRS